MTPERRISQNLGDAMLDLLHANEVQACNIESLTATVNQLVASLEHVATGLERRPTKRQTLGLVGKATVLALVVIAGVLALIWADLRSGQRYIREQVEMGGTRQVDVVCALLADIRGYHPTDPVAPGCSPPTTVP